ncbi:unnamed protein product [Adineta steineri]|uniref:Ankyrin repeat protein n=1 Tax=Adineta steineri TaxID=433720 RepID=A0A819K2J6_9BILA|nr:unnamed protein product [Adineta steineri]
MSSTTTLQLEENGNAEDKYGMTHACRAIKSGNKDLVLAYIKQGLDMNYKNSVDGVTAFIRACNSANIDMVQFLIDHVRNLNVNLTDRNGNSALYYSCQYGHNEIVHLILEKTKPKVTLSTIEKALPMMKDSVMKELIDHYIGDMNNNPGELVNVIAKGPASLALLQYVSTKTSDRCNVLDESIFLSACQSHGNIEMITWLLNDCGYQSIINTCTDSDGRTGLMLAVLRHAESVVELLLAHGANPYIKDRGNMNAVDLANTSYDDGADYMRIRDPPDEVVRIINLLTKHGNHQN